MLIIYTVGSLGGVKAFHYPPPCYMYIQCMYNVCTIKSEKTIVNNNTTM